LEIFHHLGVGSGFNELQAKRMCLFWFDAKFHYVHIIDEIFGRGVGFYVYRTLPEMGFWGDVEERRVLDEKYWGGDIPEWCG